MITREKKEHIVKALNNAAKDSQSMVFVNFHGLGVADTNELRSTLREKGIVYTVARKTLIKRALEDAKVEGDMPALDGEVALAYGDDPVEPASAIASFAKDHKEQIAIIGGVFEGEFQDKVQMETIASIPPLQTLRGMFVNVINSPIAGFAVALNAIAETKTE